MTNTCERVGFMTHSRVQVTSSLNALTLTHCIITFSIKCCNSNQDITINHSEVTNVQSINQ